MSTIDVYAVYETLDEWGRRGSLIGVFTDRDEAFKSAQGKGWWGGVGAIEERKLLSVKSSHYLLDRDINRPIRVNVDLVEEHKAAKEKALSKLTEEERELLGLNDD